MKFLLSWQLWAMLSAIFAALTAIFAKIGVSDINSNLATFLRTIVVIVILFAILIATKQFNMQEILHLKSKTVLFLILSGIGTGASWLCYFYALKIGEAAKVAPVDKLSVVFVAIFGVLFLGETLKLTNWIGIFLIVCGVIMTLL